MSTQAERIVRIEHPDGRRYAVTEATYRHMKFPHFDDGTYEDAGFKIVSYEDGTPYEDGNEPTSYGLVGAYGSPEIGEVEAEPAPSHTPSRARASATVATAPDVASTDAGTDTQ